MERHCEEFASVLLQYDVLVSKRDDSFQSKYYENPTVQRLKEKGILFNKEHLMDRHLSIIEGKMSLNHCCECSRSMV